MPTCPECIPIEQAYYNVGVQIGNERGKSEPLRQQLQESLKPPADALGQAIGERMQAEAEHTAAVQQEAALVAQISAMTGSGAFAVGSMSANDMSFTDVAGWIEHKVSATLTMWFRNQSAIEQFGKASGLASALDSLAAARAHMATTLANLQAALQREWDRERELEEAEDAANARLRQHYEAIAALEEEHERLDLELQACRARCARGERAGRAIGVVGAGLMFGGLLVLIFSGLFGAEAVQAGSGTPLTATPSATSTASPTPTGTPLPVRIGPIAATFSQPQQTTFYTVPIEGTGNSTISVAWSGPNCEASGSNGGPRHFFWYHPHPTCSPGTDHSEVTIVARIGVGGGQYECQFRGASPSGFGLPCTGPGGSRVAAAATQATPAATRAPSTTQTPAPTVAATVNIPTPSPSASVTPAGGGGTAPTPAPTTTARDGDGTAVEGEDEDGPAPGTVVGVGLVAMGGAALGASRARRGGGTRTREDGEGAGGDEGDGEGAPVGPTQARPCVELDTDGRGDDSVAKDQPFRVRVRRPRPPSGDPPQTIDVDFTADRGDDESLRLRWTGNAHGDAEYVSEPVTIDDGGTGGGKVDIAGFEFSSGDMGNDLSNVPNGERVTITVGDCTTTFKVYTTWVQQGIGRSMDTIHQTREFWTNLTEILASEPDGPEKEELLTQARHIFRLADQAERFLTNTNLLDTHRLAFLSTTASIMQSDLRGYDPRMEYQSFNAAREWGERMTTDSLMRGLRGAAIGMWRTAADVTGYASILKVGWGVDEMGTRVGRLERIFAAIDLAGRLTVYGGTARSLGGLADNVAGPGMRAVRPPRGADAPTAPPPTPGTRVSVPDADFRARQLVPDRPPVPPRGQRITQAPAGTPVSFPEEFGMLRNRARHFQSVAERHGVRIRVRPANVESLDSMADLNPPKHVKIKSKTINATDELIGAPPNSQGLVGYFEPRLPPRGTMSDADWSRVVKRYEQRLAEFNDQAHSMDKLKSQGLVRVDNGVVVDTGLSDMRVPDLRTGEMVPRGATPGGTGRPFTGDHDMWDITDPAGRPIDAATKARVEADLMDGTARTQHGPHTDWRPTNRVDEGIDAGIRSSHRGAAGPDGVVRPIELDPVNSPGRLSEGLIEFAPGQTPRVSYETGPVPATPAGGVR